jgi:hypothetical protein
MTKKKERQSEFLPHLIMADTKFLARFARVPRKNPSRWRSSNGKVRPGSSDGTESTSGSYIGAPMWLDCSRGAITTFEQP